jgi:hypothetical protein
MAHAYSWFMGAEHQQPASKSAMHTERRFSRDVPLSEAEIRARQDLFARMDALRAAQAPVSADPVQLIRNDREGS